MLSEASERISAIGCIIAWSAGKTGNPEMIPLQRDRKFRSGDLERRMPMTNELTRRAMFAASAGLAGAARLAGAPANPISRPKYYHMSQSTINYQAEFNAGKMDIFSFMDT